MSKYPCGICRTGVKHKGILCTGECKLWFHAKCLDWEDRKLKSLTKTEIENWKCDHCNTMQDKYNQERNHTINLEEMKEKILNLDNMEENSLETSLSLAAEVGNALLTENKHLKQKIVELSSENSKLTLEMEELKKSKSIQEEYQLHLEELENEKEILLNKNNTLVEKIDLLEHQVMKEKQIRIELQKIFEEQDTDKEETISKQENTIKNLQKNIEHLKENKLNNDTNHNKAMRNMETQTTIDYQNTANMNSNSFILTELAKLKTRQDLIENSVKTMMAQPQPLTLCQTLSPNEPNIENTPHTEPTIPTTMKSGQYTSQNKNRTNHAKTNNKQAGKSTIHSERRSENKSFKSKTIRNTQKNKNNIAQSQQVETTSSTSGKNAGQRNKHHEQLNNTAISSLDCASKADHHAEKRRNMPQDLDKTVTYPLSQQQQDCIKKTNRSPPMTAKRLLPEETWEQFYNKHIAEAIQTKQLFPKPPTNDKTGNFLGLVSKTLCKMKPPVPVEKSQYCTRTLTD